MPYRYECPEHGDRPFSRIHTDGRVYHCDESGCGRVLRAAWCQRGPDVAEPVVEANVYREILGDLVDRALLATGPQSSYGNLADLRQRALEIRSRGHG